MGLLGHGWFSIVPSLLLVVALLLLHHQANASSVSAACDYYQGNWVYDETYPVYDPAACPFIQSEFSCLKNGRPDLMYLKYRWQPHGCDLAR